MKFTSKLALKTALSDSIILYPIYLFVAAPLMAGCYKYSEANAPEFLFEGLRISSFFLWFCVAWVPILLAICLWRLSAIKTFIESGTEVWGSVTDLVRGSYQFKNLAKIEIGYMYKEVSYLIQKRVRLVRELKHLAIGDRIHIVIDPADPKRVLVLGP